MNISSRHKFVNILGFEKEIKERFCVPSRRRREIPSESEFMGYTLHSYSIGSVYSIIVNISQISD